MDDIPKIEFKRPIAAKPPTPTVQPSDEAVVEETQIVSSSKKRFMPAVLVILFIVVIGGGYAAFHSFITWDDGEAQVETKGAAYIPSKLPPAIESSSSLSADVASLPSGIKGKITATLLKEGGKPFDGGMIRLLSSAGKVVKESETGKSGAVVFDEVPPGSYTLSGSKKGEKRATTQQVTIGDGEIKKVTLSIFIDTNVTITVTVKKSDGTPFANQSLTLRKIRSSEGPLDYAVATNGSGIFTQSGISPDDNWLLLIEDTEVGSFGVAPTGKNQTIHVTTKSN